MILTKRITLYRSQNRLYVNNFCEDGPFGRSPRRVGGFRGSPLNRIDIMQ